MPAAPAAATTFEGADGDQLSSCATSVDWACLSPGEILTGFDGSGPSDDSFQNGSKETEPDKWQLAGSEVQDKADVRGAWAATTSSDDARTFLNVAFARAGNDGDTYLGVELNQAATTWVNSVGSTIPCRTDGDILISFAVHSPPSITLLEWNGSGGPAGCPDGAVGTWDSVPGATVIAGLNQSGPVANYLDTATFGTSFDTETFGEASLDLTALANAIANGGNACAYYRHLSVKTRSAAMISSSLQDWAEGSRIFARSCETPTGPDQTPPAVPTVAQPAAAASVCSSPVTVSGTAEPGSTVTVYDGVAALGLATADSDGDWSLPLSVLGDGVHQLSAEATDPAGNTSPRSSAIPVAVDLTAPAAPSLAAVRTGSTVEFSGSAEPGSEVTILEDGNVVATAVAGANGAFTATLFGASTGAHTYVARASDACHTSADSAPATVAGVDTTAPAAPTLAATSSCVSPVSVSGVAEPGSTVEVYGGTATVLGTAATDAGGTWSTSLSLSDGAHSLSAKATDAAANASPLSPAVGIVVDLVAPSAPTLTAEWLDGGSMRLAGSAEPGAQVSITEAGVEVATVVAGVDGAFATTLASVTPADHSYVAVASDACRPSAASSPAALSAPVEPEPTVVPTVEPTVAPTAEPTVAPTAEPSADPVVAPVSGAPATPATPTVAPPVGEIANVIMGGTPVLRECTAKPFRAYVTLRKVRAARFKIDGRTIKVVRKPDANGHFVALIDPAKLAAGPRVLTARVTFKQSGRAPRTLKLRFRKCDECQSRRSFRIRVPHLRGGERAVRADVYVNGKRTKVVRGSRLRARVVLTGLPRGTYKVKIVARTNRGRLHTSYRTYRTCVGKRKPTTKT